MYFISFSETSDEEEKHDFYDEDSEESETDIEDYSPEAHKRSNEQVSVLKNYFY